MAKKKEIVAEKVEATKEKEVEIKAVAEDVKVEVVEPPVIETTLPEGNAVTDFKIDVIVPKLADEDIVLNAVEDDNLADFPSEDNVEVIQIMNLNPAYEYLYVGKYGGVFDPSTFKTTMDNKAILYKNPYFKK